MAGGFITTDMFRTPIERLFDKTNKDGPIPTHKPELGQCWVWIGAKRPGGYGTFMAGKAMSVHRFSYQHHIGPIPEGHDVMHKCDNRACINPAHLTTGTRKQNMEDCKEKGRTSKGEHHSRQGLKESTVLEIRRLHRQGVKSIEIMKMFQLGKSCVSKIVLNQRWTHVKEPEAVLPPPVST